MVGASEKTLSEPANAPQTWSGLSGKADDVNRKQVPTSVTEHSHCRQAPTSNTPQARLCGGNTLVVALL